MKPRSINELLSRGVARLLAGAAMVLALAGCGGGGGESASDPDAGAEVVIGLTDAPGDFLSYGVDVLSLELKRANGITDPTKVWAGAVLNVPVQPDSASGPVPPQSAPPRVAHTPPRIINAAPEQPKAPEQNIPNRSDNTSGAEPPAPDTTAPKFRWPVRGKVIAGFGRRPDGTHNDGVNVSVPKGTEIYAAEAGKVAYAGNELKGYGNLVLIRHPNGWVTAYAHADQLLVRPNDEVRRGQVIAKAGRTGAVDQPQVHFELRQGSRPIDPMPHLAN